MKKLVLSLLLGCAAVAFTAAPSLAQDTTQTDQSEEDWRRSKKKDDNENPLDAIINNRTNGWGINLPPTSPVDSLPEESQRHLKQERAKAIAEAKPGETPHRVYNPSEQAKTDPELAKQEEEAWDVIMTDLKGNSQGGQPGDGPNKVAVAGQGGGQSDPSPMRGGSSASVAEILAQIKGLKQGGTGTGQGGGQLPTTGPLGGGQSPSGQGGQSGQGTQPNGQPNGQPDGQPTGSPSGQPSGDQGSRGVSAASIGDIMKGIKGGGQQPGSQPSGNGQSGSGQLPTSGPLSGGGQSGSDQNGQGQSGQSQRPQDQSGQQAGQSQSQGQEQSQSQSQNQGQSPDPAQNQGSAQAQAQAAAQASAQQAAQAANKAADQAMQSMNSEALNAAAQASQAAQQAQAAAKEAREASDQASAEAAAQAAEASAQAAAEAAQRAEQAAQSPAAQPTPTQQVSAPDGATGTAGGGSSSASDYLKRTRGQ